MEHPLTALFVDCDSYFASVEQHLDQALRGRPVGVAPVMAETSCCIAASYEAKAFGVKTGTPPGQRVRAATHSTGNLEALGCIVVMLSSRRRHRGIFGNISGLKKDWLRQSVY